ncbi:hypothetical protein BDV96DRAFT_293460 [Lophiotrema nucula]|uniref:Zn(2)-C6 fungal-type domain-containing protein n=1 Tax=Lophiotrema nucula TaxID=690887 RepID=A0A6A5YMW5_9PLEO|nr:hypothetical protein BDV96DRAFT_293460 [Lophiotrema nucula]
MSRFPARLRMSNQSRRLNTSYRRNGKLQSCEPCRKGKLKCDHMMPTCGRCARRNKPDQCVYHPAPLTKGARIPTPQSSDIDSAASVTASQETNAVSLSTLGFPPFQDEPPRLQAQRASSLPAQALPTNDGYAAIDEPRRPLPDNQLRGDSVSFPQASSFISHTAILSENETRLGILPSANPRTGSDIPQAHIDKGAIILSLLIDLPLYEKYIDRWFQLSRGIIIIEPIMNIWTRGLWSTWHTILDTQKADGLRQMSVKIWDNTMNPLESLLNRHTTPREFSANTTGENLRWEVVGIVFTMVALLAGSLQDGDPIFCSHDDPPINRNALVLKAHNAGEACLNFCKDFDVINDIYLWLLYEHTVVSNSLHAKGSYSNWQRTGYLAHALVAFGLHQEIRVDDHTPFFIAEFRKRIFICCYESDKFTSSFVGRPPSLTRQYCRIQLPLDLNDAQIMSDGLDLDNALTHLDAEGWNSRGAVQRCTFARVFASNALITEDILEVSLGLHSSEEILRRATDIEARATQLWDNFPTFLRLDSSHPWDIRRAPVEMLFLAYMHLADLGHHFLLQRTLIKKVGADATRLLAISRDILSFILVLINNRDSLRDFQIDFTQLLTMYGIPAASIIGVELLHQEQDPSSTSAMQSPLPRSDTIQDLSVFVACLGSIRPDSGGYPVCVRGKKFLKRVLDTILAPQQSTAIRSNSSAEGLGDTTWTTPLFQSGNDEDFMRWLESMEWEQESWVNFN